MRMQTRSVAAAIAGAILVALSILAFVAPPTGAAPAAEGKDYTADLRKLSSKLDEVLAAQKELVTLVETQHAAVLEELRVLKVRSFQARPRVTQ